MNLQCSPLNSTCFRVQWSRSTEIITSFNGSVVPNNPSDLRLSINDTAPDAQICQITTGSLYKFSVSAVNTGGTGESGLVTNCYSGKHSLFFNAKLAFAEFVRYSLELPTPTNVRIAVVNQTCFNVSWNSNTFENSFNATLTSSSQVILVLKMVRMVSRLLLLRFIGLLLCCLWPIKTKLICSVPQNIMSSSFRLSAFFLSTRG